MKSPPTLEELVDKVDRLEVLLLLVSMHVESIEKKIERENETFKRRLSALDNSTASTHALDELRTALKSRIEGIGDDLEDRINALGAKLVKKRRAQ